MQPRKRPSRKGEWLRRIGVMVGPITRPLAGRRLLPLWAVLAAGERSIPWKGAYHRAVEPRLVGWDEVSAALFIGGSAPLCTSPASTPSCT